MGLVLLLSVEEPGWSCSDPNISVILLRRSGEESCVYMTYLPEPGSHIIPCAYLSGWVFPSRYWLGLVFTKCSGQGGLYASQNPASRVSEPHV